MRNYGAYIAGVPELAGCMADGPTAGEALRNVEIIAQEWIETAQELGRPVPVPKGRLKYARMGLTHKLTRNRKNSGGVNGRERARKDRHPDTTDLESARNACISPLSAARDQKAGGSSPLAATLFAECTLDSGIYSVC